MTVSDYFVTASSGARAIVPRFYCPPPLRRDGDTAIATFRVAAAATRNCAGSFAKYDASRRAPFVAMLERVGAFPIPNEMIAIVCAFWLRAGEYYGGSDADARGENLENLRAMLAESDDDEGLLS